VREYQKKTKKEYCTTVSYVYDISYGTGTHRYVSSTTVQVSYDIYIILIIILYNISYI
jgi:uncharacterized membrane protein